MKFAYFTHSIISDWNNGNAHFLRGIVHELQRRGHTVTIFEPQNGWSKENLIRSHGKSAIEEFYHTFTNFKIKEYNLECIDISKELDGYEIVIVHEWNDPKLIKGVGNYRKNRRDIRLFFHDTHHRSISKPDEIASLDLNSYDGALVFGKAIQNVYTKNGWVEQIWVWHEAADSSLFKPIQNKETKNDVVWVGNWGDDERGAELKQFLFDPVNELNLKCHIYGVRYSDAVIEEFKNIGIEYLGWLPNFKVPSVFSKFRFTVHIPRRYYVENLPGIPTIRVFEALACGIPLICSPWDDCEGLFSKEKDYCIVKNKKEMKDAMIRLLNDENYRNELIEHGRSTVLKHHTCAHRVEELLSICSHLGMGIENTEK